MKSAQNLLDYLAGFSNPTETNKLITAYGPNMDDKSNTSILVEVQKTRGMHIGTVQEGTLGLEITDAISKNQPLGHDRNKQTLEHRSL